MKVKILWAALFAVCVQGHASTVLFSDLGTGGSVYSTDPGSIVQGSAYGNSIEQARGFTVSGTGNFLVSEIDLGVWQSDLGTEQFFASIWTDSGGQPGTELGSWDLTAAANGSCCTLTTQSGITGVTLDGGSAYYMVLGPQTLTASAKIYWQPDTTGETTTILASLNGGATWLSDGTEANAAFDVLGDQASAATPEPRSLLLLVTGLLLGSTLVRKKLRTAPAAQI
jgi:hypothetical protein